MKNELPSLVYYRIVAKHSRKCLDVSLAARSNGAKIHQWDCVGADNQRWQIIPVDNGCYRIVAKHSGKCLDVALAGKVNEARVHQWEYLGAPNQHWEITPVDDVFCKIVAQHSGKCLQVGGVTYTGNGSEINQLDYVAGENQKWLLVPEIANFSTHFKIVNRQNFQSFFGEMINTGVLQVHNAGLDRQRWQIVPVGDIYYKIVALPGGQCLQVGPHPPSTDQPALNQAEYVGSENQLWLLIPELAGAILKDSTGEIYILEPDHRISIPDEECLTALGRDSNTILTLDESEWKDKPIWPYLQSDPSHPDHPAALDSLVRVLTGCALWAGRSQIGAPIPQSAIGFLDLLENKTPPPAGAILDLPVGQFSPGGREEWEKGKTGVFLSHSSKDQPLARRIAEDLRQNGVYVWLDEWEIRVGDSIAQEIQKGLQQTDFVAVLLSRHSVESGWVEKEWQSKIGAEAEGRKVLILPLKCDDCAIPILLKDKKYADFARDYQTALSELLSAIKGTRLRKEDKLPADPRLAPLKFITEGGTNTIFFSIANAEHGKPVTLSAMGVRAHQHGRLFAGIPRIDLATLLEGAEIVDHNLAALNLSSGDFFVLGREVIRIEPGEVVSFSLRLCRRTLDRYLACRLIARLIGANGEIYLPSDCVYLLKPGDSYSPEGNSYGPEVLGRVLIHAAVPVADVLRIPRTEISWEFQRSYGVMERAVSYHYNLQIDDSHYDIPEYLLKAVYDRDDLNYRD